MALMPVTLEIVPNLYRVAFSSRQDGITHVNVITEMQPTFGLFQLWADAHLGTDHLVKSFVPVMAHRFPQ